MVKKIQWGKWLLVFFLMSLFTFYQLPLSQYALANTFNVINEQESPSDSDNNKDLMEADEEIPQTTDEKTAEIIIKKPVYLTIDDGPGINSKHILDVLEHYEIKATFFLVEPRVRYNPDMVIRMANEGHEIGVHGVTHDVKRFYASSRSAVNEFNKTRDTLELFTGKEHHLARTPYGSFPYLSKEQETAVFEEGYKIWDWNVDSRDWFFRNERYVQNTIYQIERLERNGIIPVILIHELGPTARHLPLLIEYLLNKDYEFRTLDINDKPVRLR